MRSPETTRRARPLATPAAALLALCLTAGAPSIAAASAPPPAERLAALVRHSAERNELPPLAPGMSYVIWVGAQRTEMDAAGLGRMNEVNRRMISSLEIRNFTVHAADCGPDMCWIRYGYRISMRMGASEVNGASEDQELWVRDGANLALAYGIARQ